MMPITERSNPPSHQRKQRADARGRQGGEDGQRVDVALIQHAEDQIDDHERRGDQDRLVGERDLKGLRVALERADQGDGRAHLGDGLVDRVDGLAERDARAAN